MGLRRRHASWLFGLALLAGASTARADGAYRDPEVLLERGALNYEAGRYQEALELLSELWAQQKTFEVADQLATVELKLQRYRDAAEHLAYALRELPGSAGPSVAGALRAKLSEAMAEVGALRVRSSVDGAQIHLDGRLVGTTPMREELFLDPGTYNVEASALGQQLAPQRLEIRRGETREITLEFSTSLTVATSQVKGPKPTGAARETLHLELEPRSTGALYVGGAFTGLALASGAAMLILANSAASDARDTKNNLAVAGHGDNPCRAPTADIASTCDGLRSNARREARLRGYAVGAFAIGGVAALGAGIYYLLQPRTLRIPIAPTAVGAGIGVAWGGTF